MFQVCFKIAFKFLWYKIDGTFGFVRKTFLLATVGLAASVLSLVVLDSVSNGYKKNFKDKYSAIESHIYISKYGDQKILESEFSKIRTALNSVNLIDYFYFETKQKAILKNSKYSEGVIVKSVVGGKATNLAPFLDSEQALLAIDQKECIIGGKLQNRLNIDKGSYIALLSPDIVKTGMLYNTALSSKVVGAVNFGIPQLDKSVVYIHKKDFEKLFNSIDATSVRVFLNDIERQNEAFKILETKLSQINQDFYMSTFDDVHSMRVSSLSEIFDSISIIIYLLIVICLFNMSSSIWLIIESKERDIKTLKLYGMSNLYLSLVFLLVISISTLTSFFIGSIISFILIVAQNTFQIVQISSDVYGVPNLVGVLDFKFLGQIFLILSCSSLILSLFTYIKMLIFTKKRSLNV